MAPTSLSKDGSTELTPDSKATVQREVIRATYELQERVKLMGSSVDRMGDRLDNLETIVGEMRTDLRFNEGAFKSLERTIESSHGRLTEHIDHAIAKAIKAHQSSCPRASQLPKLSPKTKAAALAVLLAFIGDVGFRVVEVAWPKTAKATTEAAR